MSGFFLSVRNAIAKAINTLTTSLASSNGAGMVGFLQSGIGTILRSIYDWITDNRVSVFDFMSNDEKAAVKAYIFVDVTSACQAALNAAHASKRNLYFPAGGYLVTSLTIPGNVQPGVVDDRDKGFRIYGQGFGEPFVHLNSGGTVIKSVSNQPVIKDIQGTVYSSNGTIEIDHIRFDGTSTTPVVLLDSFYGMSEFHHCVVYQRGSGSGVRITYGATWHVHHIYAMNKDWVTTGLGALRTGIGFDVPMSYDNGLQAFSKCTSRGWLTGYQLGGGAGVMYSPTIEQCECSMVYNGIRLFGTRKAVIDSCYLEGGEGGIGIYDEGNYTTISNNLIFPGFAKGVDASNTSTQGTTIEKNTVGIGAVANAMGIDVQSSANFGGYNKNIQNNSISYTPGTAGVTGIKVQGIDPRINVMGNMFDPRGAWTGAGTVKINDASSGGVFGILQKPIGDYEIPVLSRGAMFLQEGFSALTQASVSGTTLTIPEVGNYFSCNASSPCNVQIISAGVTPGRLVIFRTVTANMTFQDTAYIQLAGNVSFTGPGIICLMIDRVGGSNYAYEISRSVF